MKKNKKQTIDTICLIVLLIIALISGFLFFKYIIRYKNSDNFYTKTNENIEINIKKPEINIKNLNKNFIIEENEFDLDIDFNEYPEDVIGWIFIPDEKEALISYPILQGKNYDYYLNHDYSGHYNIGGSIFLNYENSPYLTDYHSIIYGHNMNSGKMFSKIKKYIDQEFADNHRYAYIKMRDGTLKKYYVYSAFRAEDLTESYNINIKNPEEQLNFINYTLEKSKINANFTFEENKLYRIVSLSTCVSGKNKLERSIAHMVEI